MGRLLTKEHTNNKVLVYMSDSKKKNQKFHASVKETTEKLRTLADELEKGFVAINDEEHPFTLDTAVKISLKSKDDTLSFKLKFNLSSPSVDKKEKLFEKDKPSIRSTKNEGIESEPKPSKDQTIEEYKDLKKRMAIDFKAIMKSCIKEKSIPEITLVEKFYRDSQALCNYPDRGEEFYEAFLKQASLFYKTFKKSDLSAMSSAITSLSQIKKECHDKYK